MSADRPPATHRERYAAALKQQREDWERQRRMAGPPVPQRITDALNLAELYGPEVDRACGVEEPTVDRWEDPTDPLLPTREQVQALAELTGFPVEFFYRPAVDIPLMFICTRTGRGKGCQVVDNRKPEPVAEVVPLFGQGSLW